MMHLKQHYLRYLYVGAFVAVLVSVGLGVLAWGRFAAPAQRPTANEATTLKSNAPVHATVTLTPAAHATPVHKHVVPTPVIAARGVAAAHLVIPAIGVDAPIETVGLDPMGRMGVPTRNQWNGVGWYQNGTSPGAPGSSVIDGHLDTTTGAPAVFWRLNALHIGDLVTVQDSSGRKAQFRVFKTQSYSADSAPLDQIFSRNDGTYLNLITCAGSWDYSHNQFQQRLVVFTQAI
ncbi:MAG: hypothetical protein NVSMB44_45600 [Ktedonobacteraceae bacterium]